MSTPQFPDPLGRRELNRPGATAHKAGLALEERVKALELGAAGRPGPGVSNGSVITSDTTQTGGVKWQSPARDVMVMQGGGFNTAGAAASVYVLVAQGAVGTAADVRNAPIFRYIAADWTLPDGRTPKFILRSNITPNATSPGGNHNAVLAHISTLNGGAGTINVAFDAYTINNAHGAVAASTINAMKSAATTLVDGESYMFGWVTSAVFAANSVARMTSQLYATYEA